MPLSQKMTKCKRDQSHQDSRVKISKNDIKQDKYTMDPGRQIHLNNIKKSWSKIIFEQQNQKNFPEKNVFL